MQRAQIGNNTGPIAPGGGAELSSVLAGEQSLDRAVAPVPGMAGLWALGARTVIENPTELLASQRKFAGDVLRATTPLLPGKGGTGAKKSGGEAKQASSSRRPGPATCDRSTARRRADRGSPRTCLPS